jgi:hypothetical protein
MKLERAMLSPLGQMIQHCFGLRSLMKSGVHISLHDLTAHEAHILRVIGEEMPVNPLTGG